ncbi:hypothetical protein [Haliangium sp. UPWRP_2]|uniref:hypothetical protein n=1 Tax=Haliangium sp. UPWRP_2 TaxID=1931276 RepID=UPI0011B21602|nr:hypothetical protein [Haliangium sp. UPWRP_2]PSM31943.1 hypothetical protein BVG81_002800 [Haliangium sp. UPWRP_2]
MSGVVAAVERRNEELASAAARVRERNSGAPIAAIELCAEGGQERATDRQLVRAALAAGASPIELGPIFICVVADVTYDVDWGDQFKFWPILAKELAAPGFDLEFETSKRRATASAFDEFAGHHGGIEPVGSFASQYPFMSRPLVNSMLPKCAQRHIARLFARASSLGALPMDPSSQWPLDDLVALSEKLRLPLFVQGLIENRGILDPVGRALLGLSGTDPPAWVKRVSENVRTDRIASDLLDRTREGLRAARLAGRAKRDLTPQIHLSLTADAPAPLFCIHLAPLGAFSQPGLGDLLPFARSGARLRLVVNKKPVDERPLADALTAPVVVQLPDTPPPYSITFIARPYKDQVPEQVRAYLERATRDIKVPLVLIDQGGRQFIEAEPPLSIEEGKALVIVARSDDAIVGDLATIGFTIAPIGTSSRLLALHGTAVMSAALTLGRIGVAVRSDPTELQPIITPPIRRDGNTLVYAPGSDIWLLIRNIRTRASLRIELSPPDAGRVDVLKTDHGANVLHLTADEPLEVRVLSGVHARPICRSTILLENPRDVVEPLRWRATLQPVGATMTHIVERLCWLAVETLPGVTLRFELEVVSGAIRRKAARIARVEDLGTPLATMRFLNQLLDNAELRPEDALPSEVIVRARSEEEPDVIHTIACIRDDDATFRFNVGEAAPTVSCAGGATSLFRLDLSAPGIRRLPATTDDLRTPGVYVAMYEGVYAALCVGERTSRLPRLRAVQPPPRSLRELRDLVALLRALDVAGLWPSSAYSHALFLRRVAVRAAERAIIGSLCGEEWLQAEDTLPEAASARLDGVRRLVPQAWISEETFNAAFADAEDGDDPFSLLSTALHSVSLVSAERDAARHLLLLFYKRGLASPIGDERALRLAWSNRQVSRLVRMTYLVLPDALAGWQRSRQAEMVDDG